MNRVLLSTAAFASLFVATPLLAQAGAGGSEPSLAEDKGRQGVQITGHVVKPMPIKWSEERMARLALPPGFDIAVFADNLENPRMMDVSDDGTLYVTRRKNGDVLMLRDTNGDGRADIRQVVASKEEMHGIELDGDTIYLATVNDVMSAPINADGTLGELTTIVDDLPEGGQHPNRMVVKGPDGRLYVSVGSTCNACGETNEENATITVMNTDGSGRQVFASGLRNTIGYGFEPDTGKLYGFDHGIDWLGDNEQPGEFNLIEQGQQYGWPYVYAMSEYNPQDVPPDMSFSEYAAKSREPIGLHTPHAAPMQMIFHDGKGLPKGYSGDAFIAFRGSWNRMPPSGYEVMRVDFDKGRPVAMAPFVTGFLMKDETSPTGWGHMGRLAGIAEGPDGAIYLSDDEGGVIYKISYVGRTAAKRPRPEFTNADSVEDELGLVKGKNASAD